MIYSTFPNIGENPYIRVKYGVTLYLVTTINDVPCFLEIRTNFGAGRQVVVGPGCSSRNFGDEGLYKFSSRAEMADPPDLTVCFQLESASQMRVVNERHDAACRSNQKLSIDVVVGGVLLEFCSGLTNNLPRLLVRECSLMPVSRKVGEQVQINLHPGDGIPNGRAGLPFADRFPSSQVTSRSTHGNPVIHFHAMFTMHHRPGV